MRNIEEQRGGRLLVTGVSGFLGWNVAEQAAATRTVTGMACLHPYGPRGIEIIQVDFARRDMLRRALDRCGPCDVIHTAALSSPAWCEAHAEASLRVNADSSRMLAGWCRRNGTRMLFTSSDLVFDGTCPPYGESDPVSPLSVYGCHKVMAERTVLAHGGIVCRMPLMFGTREGRAAGFAGLWMEALQKGEPLTLFTDEYRTPVSVAAAAAGLLRVLEAGAPGIYHLGGRERISRYDFGLEMADVFGLRRTLIQPAALAAGRYVPPRPPDVSLASEKAFRLGFAPHSIHDLLCEMQESIGTQGER